MKSRRREEPQNPKRKGGTGRKDVNLPQQNLQLIGVPRSKGLPELDRSVKLNPHMLVLVQWYESRGGQVRSRDFQLRNIESSCDKLEVAWKDFEERKKKA